MPMPDVITECNFEELNFTFRVRAFRHVTEEEMSYLLREWMRVNRLKKLPQNKIGEVLSLFGSERR